jgi:hypothetical protein
MIDENTPTEYELVVYKTGSSLLATVKIIKENIGCGLKLAKTIVDSFPDRRHKYTGIENEVKDVNKFANFHIKLLEDKSVITFNMKPSWEFRFRTELLSCGNDFTLSGLRAIREKKLGEILD